MGGLRCIIAVMDESKKVYIATAIPYVNGKPHVGHAMDYLLADIWARYQRQNGKEVRFQVGTDEHGSKNAAKAKELGLTTQQFVDQNYLPFEALMQKMKVTYTDFIRTTDPKHVARVQYIWKKLQPHIYKGKYEGWYCEGCEGFVTNKEAAEKGGVCSDHQTPLVKLEEENYFLRIGDFATQIREAIETGRMKIVPEFRGKEFLALMERGMPDVSVSRPRKSLSWGVAVPDDPDQVMYVWIDALANYITVLGYPDSADWAEYWPADVQVLGKDILRFHAGIWPAILLGLGLELPKMLLVHGHVTTGGEKMSKTVGNVVDPMEVLEKYGLDAFRYYFSRHVTTDGDGDFTWERFENAYNNELADDLGNLVQRTAGMVNRYLEGVSGEVGQIGHDTFKFHESMSAMKFSEAFESIWALVMGANRYVDKVKPWAIAKRMKESNDPDDRAHLEEVLRHTVETILQVAKMMEPFMPDAAERISGVFNTGVVKLPEGGVFPKIYIHTTDPRTARGGVEAKVEVQSENAGGGGEAAGEVAGATDQ